MFRIRFLLLVISVALAAPPAFAQTAEIVGRVTDAGGAVLPGATVTIQNVGTNDTRSTVTGATGDFGFTLLPIGTYSVLIDVQGFQTYRARAALASGDRARVDASLRVGNVAEKVTVAGEVPLVQTDSSSVGLLLTQKAVAELPVVGRNFVQLVQLVPGANEGAPDALASGNRPLDRRQTSAVSIRGAGDNQNNQLIDGMDNNERYNGTIGVKPSIDAIAEIRVSTSLYTAEAGRTGGGVVNIITKSGTNELRGSAYAFYRNDRFDARDYFATVDPILNQHQYGGSLSGPVVPDRTFFFGDYERLRSDRGQVNTLTVPTMKMRQGDFSESGTQIYDPFTTPRTPFDGNRIPAHRMDAIALRYMALFPEPTSAGLANNYQSTTEGHQYSHTTDVRIDHRFDASNSIWGRFSYNNLDHWTPAGCPLDAATGIHPGCLVSVNGTFPGPNQTTVAGYQGNYVRSFSPTLLAEVKVNVLDLNIGSYAANRNDASAAIGIPGANSDPMSTGLAIVNITGYATLGDGQFLPVDIRNRTKQLHVMLTKTHGAHSLKFGGGWLRRRFSVAQSPTPNGRFDFNRNLTASATNQGGHPLASFLIGAPNMTQRNHAAILPWYHSQEPSIFAQDDWRTTSWLTVNLGVRYDVFTSLSEEQNILSNLDLAGGTVLVAGRNASRAVGVKTDYSNLAPRFGLAATLPHAWVLRGGYGLSYFPNNQGSFALMKNPPFFGAYSVISAGDTGGVPDILLRQGVPVPQFSDAVPAAAQVSGSFNATDLDYRNARYQQFNVQLEKDIAGNVVTVGYVGQRGDFELPGTGLQFDINLAPVGPGPVQQRRRYASVFPRLSAIIFRSSSFESRYDAAQFIFQRRFHRGFSVTTHYTRAVAEVTQPLPWMTVDPTTGKLTHEWMPNANSRPHAWVLQASYAFPWAGGLAGVRRALFAGWQLNASAFWQAGRSYGVTNVTERANTGGIDRPNLVGDPILPKSERTVRRWFNTEAFAAQPQFTVGNAPAFVDYGPPQRRLDLSLFKDLAFGGARRLQLRYEAYNVTNTPSFNSPNTAFGTAAFGTVTSTGNNIPRQMQFAVKFLF